ncbi:hypothetical protein LCGC14_2874410, partial [marine sediment metagenome]
MDIWVSETTREGDWGKPRNLGPKINSHYSEETPFLAGGGKKLYFSSQGHATMGGFDFFVADKIPPTGISPDRGANGKDDNDAFDDGWSFPGNLGYPLSTADDDLFYYPRKSGQGAYYSSIIEEINPTRSIYIVRIIEEETKIAAIRQDQDERIDPLTLKTTDTFPGDGSLAGDESTADSIPIREDKTASVWPVPDPEEYFVLNSIQFGFDSDAMDESVIAEAQRVFEVMHKNPGIRLQLTGHTDAVGADDYNQ